VQRRATSGSGRDCLPANVQRMPRRVGVCRVAALLVLGVSPDNGVVLQIKNEIKRFKLRLGSGRETDGHHHEN